jgi:hypothetical protein
MMKLGVKAVTGQGQQRKIMIVRPALERAGLKVKKKR